MSQEPIRQGPGATDTEGDLRTSTRDVDHGGLGRFVFWFGVALSAALFYFNTLGTLPSIWLSAIHWGGFGLLCALMYPVSAALDLRAPRASFAADLVVGVLALACAGYVMAFSEALYDRGVSFIWSDWLMSAVGVALALEFARRTAGWFIPLLCLIAVTYVFWWGQHIGGMFRFPGLTLETTLFRSYFEVSGMFGQIARISSTFVFMFILFGAFLVRSGAGDFVIDMARSLAGRMVGGPGLVAVIGSALTGTVSGSAVANTVSTGSVTIPLMKRAGFPGQFAAGVEASASTGGQLMPPIMGAGAFVMASYTQIPYLTIVAVALLPALMYFLTVGFWVRIEAKKQGLGTSEEVPPTFLEIMRRGGISFLLPIAVLVVLLVMGYTPTYAAAGGILAVIVASWMTPKPMGPWAILEAMALGARNMVPTAVLLVAVGLIVMSVSATGVGNTISLLMADWAGGSLIVAIVLVALASLVLGMGLPVTAAYIVLGTLSAPALNELISQAHLIDLIAAGELPQQARSIFMLAAPDQMAALSQPMSEAQALALLDKVPPDFTSQLFEQALSPEVLTTALLSAHMIIFWLSQDSNVTPPVCLAAFAAAAIARTPPMATGFTAWRIAKGMYIIPLLFAYTPLLSGDWSVALEIAFFGSIGLYGLASAYEGYGEAPVPLALRPVLLAAGVGSLWPLGLPWHALAAVLVIGVTVLTVVLERRRRPARS